MAQRVARSTLPAPHRATCRSKMPSPTREPKRTNWNCTRQRQPGTGMRHRRAAISRVDSPQPRLRRPDMPRVDSNRLTSIEETTMSIEQVFKAICENPEDDERRLEYADLIERSDPDHAKFIRWQVRYADERRHGVEHGGGE